MSPPFAAARRPSPTHPSHAVVAPAAQPAPVNPQPPPPPARPRVIALCGRRRVGKDTIADLFCAETGYQRVAIAWPIKRTVAKLFGLTGAQVDGDEKDVPLERWDGVTPRALCQWFGTEVMQHALASVVPSVGRGFWIERALDSIDPDRPGVLITDVRFLHEAAAVRRRYPDATIVRVVRDANKRACGVEDQHESEAGCDAIPVDAVVVNDGAIIDLYRQFVAAVAACSP